MARCISLDLECADLCQLAAASIARGGEHMKALCSLCIEVCKSCGEVREARHRPLSGMRRSVS